MDKIQKKIYIIKIGALLKKKYVKCFSFNYQV